MAPEEAFALTEKLFGSWTSDTPPPPELAERAGAVLAPRTILIDAPDMGQAAVYLAGRGVTRQHPDYPALELADAVLGGGSSGRLFEAIRTERALSYGSYSSVYAMAEEPMFTARTQTAHETAAEVAKVMLEQFARFGTEPITQDWLDARRLYLTGQFDRARETSSGYAALVALALEQGLDPAAVDAYAASLAAVTTQQASAAGQRYFNPEAASLIVVGKADVIAEELRALRPDLVVLPVRSLDLSNASLGAE